MVKQKLITASSGSNFSEEQPFLRLLVGNNRIYEITQDITMRRFDDKEICTFR